MTECILQGGDFEEDSIYQCPYEINGDTVTVHNPIRIKLLAMKDKKMQEYALNLWDTVTLLMNDQLDVTIHRYVHNYKLDGSEIHLTLDVEYPSVLWNGKFFTFHTCGPTSTENLRDLRPICTHCGILVEEGDHTTCLLKREEY